MFGDDFSLKLIDFGLATDTSDQKIVACGKYNYIPPEVHYRRGYKAENSDIFACGVTLFNMMTGRPPF